MKNLMMLAVIAVLGAGCATTSAARDTEDSLEVTALKEQNAELQKRLEALEKTTDSRKAAPVVVVPGGPVGAPMMASQMVPPPPKPLPPGPPQNWAWLHSRPYGCESGPFAMEVHNLTAALFMRLSVDGEEVIIRGANGPLATRAPDGTMMTPLPPDARMYMCLKSLGAHTVTGVLYADRMGVLSEVKRFSRPISFTLNSGAATGQHMNINDMFMAGF